MACANRESVDFEAEAGVDDVVAVALVAVVAAAVVAIVVAVVAVADADHFA